LRRKKGVRGKKKKRRWRLQNLRAKGEKGEKQRFFKRDWKKNTRTYEKKERGDKLRRARD